MYRNDIYLDNDDDDDDDDNEQENEPKEKDEESKEPSFTEKLLKSRKVVISTSVTPKLAERVINQLLLLQEMDNKKDITIFLNSPGGDVFSGMAIFDMMTFIKPKVKVVVVGLAASMGSLLVLAANKGQRFALPHAKILIHQPLISGVYRGTATDLDIHAKDMIETKNRIIDLYVEATGKPFDEVKKDIDRDCWLTAEQALNYGSKGLIDKIITKFSDLEK